MKKHIMSRSYKEPKYLVPSQIEAAYLEGESKGDICLNFKFKDATEDLMPKSESSDPPANVFRNLLMRLNSGFGNRDWRQVYVAVYDVNLENKEIPPPEERSGTSKKGKSLFVGNVSIGLDSNIVWGTKETERFGLVTYYITLVVEELARRFADDIQAKLEAKSASPKYSGKLMGLLRPYDSYYTVSSLHTESRHLNLKIPFIAPGRGMPATVDSPINFPIFDMEYAPDMIEILIDGKRPTCGNIHTLLLPNTYVLKMIVDFNTIVWAGTGMSHKGTPNCMIISKEPVVQSMEQDEDIMLALSMRRNAPKQSQPPSENVTNEENITHVEIDNAPLPQFDDHQEDPHDDFDF